MRGFFKYAGKNRLTHIFYLIFTFNQYGNLFIKFNYVTMCIHSHNCFLGYLFIFGSIQMIFNYWHTFLIFLLLYCLDLFIFQNMLLCSVRERYLTHWF